MIDGYKLPDGKSVPIWEDKTIYTRTYYVDQKNADSDDNGEGTAEKPFKTINKAASVAKACEKVLICRGVYRETISPVNFGNSNNEMIFFENFNGEEVIVKGSVILSSTWGKSDGFNRWGFANQDVKVWKISLKEIGFNGYNPFAMNNLPHDRTWIDFKNINIKPFLQKRGMVFMDGARLLQADTYAELRNNKNMFWIENSGLALHLSLDSDDDPDNHLFEAAIKESLFNPVNEQTGYIHIKGITFEHCANGYPVPQTGAVSANRGHHFIIENCLVNWANSLGIDVGNKCWNTTSSEQTGYHIIINNYIKNCGICGLAAFYAPELVIFGNTVENCCWQDAEQMAESAGIKLHHAKDVLIAKNVIRGMLHGCGFWLDYSNENCRISGNVFTDITSANGGVLIEATHKHILIDNNIIWDIKSTNASNGDYGIGGFGIFALGTDKLTVANNLIGLCGNTGFFSAAAAARIVENRGGTGRNNKVINNVFKSCNRAAIEFANKYNYSNGNIFSTVQRGSLRIGTTDNPYDVKNLKIPFEQLDIECFREFYNFEIDGEIQDYEIVIDFEEMFIILNTALKNSKCLCEQSDTDFFGNKRILSIPGPFQEMDLKQKMSLY